MCVVISPVLFGGFAIRAMDPIESDSPKIRSARVSIRGRGWTTAFCCCIDRLQEIVAIWSFGERPCRIETYGFCRKDPPFIIGAMKPLSRAIAFPLESEKKPL